MALDRCMAIGDVCLGFGDVQCAVAPNCSHSWHFSEQLLELWQLWSFWYQSMSST